MSHSSETTTQDAPTRWKYEVQSVVPVAEETAHPLAQSPMHWTSFTSMTVADVSGAPAACSARSMAAGVQAGVAAPG